MDSQEYMQHVKLDIKTKLIAPAARTAPPARVTSSCETWERAGCLLGWGGRCGWVGDGEGGVMGEHGS